MQGCVDLAPSGCRCVCGVGGRAVPEPPLRGRVEMGDDGWMVRGMCFRAGGNNGGGDSVREQRREGWVPASARTTGGEGQPQGLPLRGADGGGSSRTGSSVWTGGSRTVPTGRVGWMGMTGGGCGVCGSAQVGTMAGEILCGNNGGRGGVPAYARTTGGEGQPQGLPLRRTDGVEVFERVRQCGRAVPEPPLREGDGFFHTRGRGAPPS